MSVTPLFGHVAVGAATHATTATVEDANLADIATALTLRAVEMAESPDEAARGLLLAAADLLHDDTVPYRAGAVSTMLLDAVREALDAYLNPPPAFPANTAA